MTISIIIIYAENFNKCDTLKIVSYGIAILVKSIVIENLDNFFCPIRSKIIYKSLDLILLKLELNITIVIKLYSTYCRTVWRFPYSNLICNFKSA